MDDYKLTDEQIEELRRDYRESLDEDGDLIKNIENDTYYTVCIPQGHENAIVIYNENCAQAGQLAYCDERSNDPCGYPHGDVTFFTGTDDELEKIAESYEKSTKDGRPGHYSLFHARVAETIRRTIRRTLEEDDEEGDMD